jgi:glycosyltransferase involved in cell wall biosynthesis
MSTIAVVTSSPPLAEGGHLVIARSLVAALRAAGHDADIVITPQNRFGRNVSSYLANRLTDVGRTADGRRVDQVISLRWPSYAVRHPAHVSWLNHTAREYYDLWDQFSAGLSSANRVKEQIRRSIIHRADTWLLGSNVTRLMAQSKTVQERLRRFNGLESEVVYPPAPQRAYRCDAFEPFFFAVSRFAPLKRLDLLVEALARPEAAGIRAVIAGDGEQWGAIRQLVAERGLAERVTLPGRVDEATLVDYYARCRAVVFTPLEEDFGFVTVEAFASGKPVVTTIDSGGPAELVDDAVTGRVVTAEAASLASALRELAESEALAVRLGAAAATRSSTLSWAATVDRLLLPLH